MLKEHRKQQGIAGRFLVILTLLSVIITSGILPGAKADAAALKIKYGGKTYSYTSSKAKVTLDGKNKSTGSTPGLLINNTCMVPAANIFKTGLGCNFSYNSKTGKIIISKNNITVKMTVNSKTGYVNGKKKTIDEAPKRIKFVSKNITKLYVPSRFVAEALGYTYNWNSSTKSADITSPLVIKYNKEWVTYKGTKGQVIFDGKAVKQTGMPSIILNDTVLLQASPVFKTAMGADYTYDSTAKQVTISQNEVTIIMNIDSKTATVNGATETMPAAARLVWNKDTEKSYVMVPGEFVATSLGYKYSWNAGKGISSITTDKTIYFSQKWNPESNSNTIITAIEGKYEDGTDVISITGTSPLEVVVTETSDTILTLTIDGVDTSQIEALEKSISNGFLLNSVSLSVTETGIAIVIEKEPSSTYYTMNSGNTFKLILSEGEDSDISDSSYQIKLTAAEDMDYENITTEDLYFDNQFTITIPGDYEEHFSANPIKFDSSVIDDLSYELNSDGDTQITVNTKKLQGYKLNNCGTYIGVEVGNPSSIYENIVVLDPGHGGSAVGTSNKGIYEKNLNLEILYDKARNYFNSPDSPIKAYWTRTDDSNPSLTDRAKFAASVEADVFISLHMNSAGASASGTEVLYASNNKNKMNGMTSKDMAVIFQDYLEDELGLTGRKIVDRTKLVVLYKNVVPAILIELGFLSNKSDYAQLIDEDFQEQAAKAIYDAAVQMFETYPTGR